VQPWLAHLFVVTVTHSCCRTRASCFHHLHRRRAALVSTPRVLDAHHPRLRMQQAEFGLLAAIVHAVRGPLGAALVGTPLSRHVHHPRLCILQAEFGLRAAIGHAVRGSLGGHTSTCGKKKDTCEKPHSPAAAGGRECRVGRRGSGSRIRGVCRGAEGTFCRRSWRQKTFTWPCTWLICQAPSSSPSLVRKYEISHGMLMLVS